MSVCRRPLVGDLKKKRWGKGRDGSRDYIVAWWPRSGKGTGRVMKNILAKCFLGVWGCFLKMHLIFYFEQLPRFSLESGLLSVLTIVLRTRKRCVYLWKCEWMSGWCRLSFLPSPLNASPSFLPCYSNRSYVRQGALGQKGKVSRSREGKSQCSNTPSVGVGINTKVNRWFLPQKQF